MPMTRARFENGRSCLPIADDSNLAPSCNHAPSGLHLLAAIALSFMPVAPVLHVLTWLTCLKRSQTLNYFTVSVHLVCRLESRKFHIIRSQYSLYTSGIATYAPDSITCQRRSVLVPICLSARVGRCIDDYRQITRRSCTLQLVSNTKKGIVHGPPMNIRGLFTHSLIACGEHQTKPACDAHVVPLGTNPQSVLGIAGVTSPLADPRYLYIV